MNGQTDPSCCLYNLDLEDLLIELEKERLKYGETESYLLWKRKMELVSNYTKS